MIALGTVSWMFFCVMRKYDRMRRSETERACLVGESHNNNTAFSKLRGHSSVT